MPRCALDDFQVDGSYLCPKCGFPMCEEMCAYGEDHSSLECPVFAAMDEPVAIDDFDEAHPVYWNITVLRALLLKEREPDKYGVVKRMMDHNEMHR